MLQWWVVSNKMSQFNINPGISATFREMLAVTAPVIYGCESNNNIVYGKDHFHIVQRLRPVRITNDNN